jgi:hypothetical protein
MSLPTKFIWALRRKNMFFENYFGTELYIFISDSLTTKRKMFMWQIFKKIIQIDWSIVVVLLPL